jgi:NitT/TauT family transport system permease protein
MRGKDAARPLRLRLESVGFLLLLALVWEGVSRAALVSPLYFPPMSRILATFAGLTADGTLPLEVLRSFGRMFAGYFLAAALMIPLGVGMGVSRRLHHLFEPLVEFLRPLPPPAIIPAVMLFLGIGDSMKIFVIFFACSFPIVLNTLDGVRSVEPLLLATARSFGHSSASIVRKVVLPAAWPQIMSGLRISLPISLIVAVLSEMIGSVDGIGHFILKMQRTFNIPEMYAGIVMLGITGFGLNALFMRMDKRLLSWHEGWKRGGAANG